MDTSIGNLTLVLLAVIGIGLVAVVWSMTALWWRAAHRDGPLLLEKMLRRQGLERAGAPQSADFELAFAARRCALCARQEQCRLWLAAGERTGYESFCPNAPLIERLKEGWTHAGGRTAHAA
jgi:hypothetical protein